MNGASFKLVSHSGGMQVLALEGEWTLSTLGGGMTGALKALSQHAKRPELGWDLRKVAVLDSTGAMLLWRAWGGKRPAVLLLRPEHEAVLQRISRTPAVPPPQRRMDLLEPLAFVGRSQARLLDHCIGVVTLIGYLVLDALYALTHPRAIPWREISATIFKAGALALPVTALVGFLIGVVLSYLSALTLKAYGADLYIVNILGLSIIRELGPLLVAILLAGRSGSAMTAQIGVMRVTEEIDAMVTIGLSPTLRLVLPKVIGLAIAMPLVAVWAIFMALLGGMASANIQLGISYAYFFDALPRAVPIANIWIALFKTATFGIVIAVIACHYGLRVRPNTESVASGITSAVVTSITLVILLDAVYAIVFRDVGF
jgi:phospholipid/cholesterol/gamma-HCH transport system permease protein